MNTYDIAKRFGVSEAEVAILLQKVKDEARVKNRARKATLGQQTLESIKGRGGISVPRVRCLEEGGSMGSSVPSEKKED